MFDEPPLMPDRDKFDVDPPDLPFEFERFVVEVERPLEPELLKLDWLNDLEAELRLF